MKLTGAEILMECLLEQEVDTVFGYPGGTILYVYDALVKYYPLQPNLHALFFKSFEHTARATYQNITGGMAFPNALYCADSLSLSL